MTGMVSKLDLALTLAVVASGVIFIERAHRIVIEPPAPAAAAAPAPACPDNDTVPYSASCLAFLGHGYALHMNWQANAAEGAAPRVPQPSGH
jgi:hypothetical protein